MRNARRAAKPRRVVKRIHAAGPQVKLELASDFGERVDAEISQERFRDLRIAVGDDIFLSPREIKVFFEDFSI